MRKKMTLFFGFSFFASACVVAVETAPPTQANVAEVPGVVLTPAYQNWFGSLSEQNKAVVVALLDVVDQLLKEGREPTKYDLRGVDIAYIQTQCCFEFRLHGSVLRIYFKKSPSGLVYTLTGGSGKNDQDRVIKNLDRQPCRGRGRQQGPRDLPPSDSENSDSENEFKGSDGEND